MTDHLSRAAAIDWRDEAEDEASRAVEPEADPAPSAPRLGATELIAGLRCPVGRIRLEPGGTPVTAEADPWPVGQVTAFPNGKAHKARRSAPPETAREMTPDTRRMRSPTRGASGR